MGIISKITPQQDPNQLGGKPVRITKFKDGEILAYNSVSKQWEAIPNPTLAQTIDAATAKTPLVDTDTFPLTEPTTLKKTLWSTIKSTLKTYFDTLYVALTGNQSVAGIKTFTDGIIVKSYERHVQIPAEANGAPASTPVWITIGTAGALQYSAALAKYAYCQWEIPDDWAGDNIYFEVDWLPDSGAMSDPDTIKWDVNYRSIAEGELITNGTMATASVTFTGDLAQNATKHGRVTLTFNHANQPLTKQDHIYFQITRDVGVADDFSGTVAVTAYEIIYNSVGLPTSN